MIRKIILRISALTFAVMIACATALIVSASEVEDIDTPSVISNDRSDIIKFGTDYALTDDASVFTEEQAKALIAEMKVTGAKTGWQIIIHTSNDGISSDEDLESHYNNYYDSQYDKGNFKYDALMLVIDRKSGKRDILCYGKVRDYFKDSSRYDIIKDAMKPYLKQDNMYDASLQFIDKAEEIYDMGATSAFVLSLKKFGWIAGIAGVVVGVIVFFVIKSKYKNMGKSGTYDLVSNSSVDLNDVEDTFVTQHTTVRTIEKSSSSSDSGSSHSGGGNSSGGF